MLRRGKYPATFYTKEDESKRSFIRDDSNKSLATPFVEVHGSFGPRKDAEDYTSSYYEVRVKTDASYSEFICGIAKGRTGISCWRRTLSFPKVQGSHGWKVQQWEKYDEQTYYSSFGDPNAFYHSVVTSYPHRDAKQSDPSVCAIRSSNGAVECWGYAGSDHRIKVPSDLGSVSELVEGPLGRLDASYCAIRPKLGVRCWGYDSHHQLKEVRFSKKIKKVLGSAVYAKFHEYYGCALQPDCRLSCFKAFQDQVQRIIFSEVIPECSLPKWK